MFAATNGPALPGGLFWTVKYRATDVDLRVGTAADTDGDGLPDAWEIEWLGGLDASDGRADDFDADGVPDATECGLGTDPVDPESNLARGTIAGTVTYAGAQTGPVHVAVQGPAPNSALTLDGVGDYVDVPDGVWFNTNFTVEAWVYLREYRFWCRLFDFGNGAPNNNVLFALSRERTGMPQFEMFNGGTSMGTLNAPDALPLNRWIHLAITRTAAGAVTVYRDGVPWFGSSSYGAPTQVTRNSCFIGKSLWGGDEQTKGLIDDFRIWSVACSGDDIRTNMCRRLTGAEPGLRGYWRFDRLAHDLADGRQHGVFSGNATNDPSGPPLICAETVLGAPGAYRVGNLPLPRTYSVQAFRDADGDGIENPSEPRGGFAGNPLPLAADTNGVDIALSEGQDADGDGLTDAVERGWGRYQLVAFSGTWAQAKADAIARGGHLATITSFDEWLDILRVVGTTNLFNRSAWIGGSDEAVEGAWKWVTGETGSGYARWASGEPNNSGNEDYAHLWANTGSTMRWADGLASLSLSWYLFERGWYTSATDADCDDDGIPDGAEVLTYGSNPLVADSDGDGLGDGVEVGSYGSDPMKTDSDGDGLGDGFEVNTFHSHPALADTDEDGFDDHAEWVVLTDPNDDTSYLRVAALAVSDGAVQVEVASSTGVEYRLQSAPSLPAAWADVTNLMGTGGMIIFTNPVVGPRMFFRIQGSR